MVQYYRFGGIVWAKNYTSTQWPRRNQVRYTGAWVSQLFFSTTYQHPEFGQSTGFDYTRTKIQLAVWEVLAAIESKQTMPKATSSGMAAIAIGLYVFPVGSKVLAVRDLMVVLPLVQPSGAGRRFHFTYANTCSRVDYWAGKLMWMSSYRNANHPLMLEFDIAKLPN